MGYQRPLNGKRPNPFRGRVINIESTGKSFADVFSLTSDFKLKGISLETSYKFKRFKSDHEGVFDLPSDNYNLRADWGAESGEATHNINVFTSFNLFKLLSLKPLKDLTASINFTASSGFPYTVITGRDDNEDGVINDRPQGVKRNSERESWTFSTDLSLSWNIPNFLNGNIDRMSLNFDVNNLFNQTNKRGYVGVQTSPFFGQPTYSAPARSVSFGLHISF